MSRSGAATLDKLASSLPDASAVGLSPDPSDVFKAFATETTVRGVGRKYHALVVHKTWWFPDPEISRQLDQLKVEKERLKQEQSWKPPGLRVPSLMEWCMAGTSAEPYLSPKTTLTRCIPHGCQGIFG
jgi:hypothetical protein